MQSLILAQAAAPTAGGGSLISMLLPMLLIFGIFSRIAAAALGIEMIFAIFLTGIGKGFGPHEMEILLMAGSLGIALVGSGKFALYKMECDNCAGMLCKGECK